MNSYFVYIITNYTNSVYYTGVTNDLERRIYEHKHGVVKSSFSKKYRLYKLLWFEEFSDINDAIENEKRVKKWSRQKKLDLISTINPNVTDLAATLC